MEEVICRPQPIQDNYGMDWRDNYADAPLTQHASQPEWSLLELIDGAYEIVELWPALTPAQKIWKRRWLAEARNCGAIQCL
jgi:hypothetical protein